MKHHHDLHVILTYKNFAANKGISHIGLGVAAMNTAKVLKHLGIRCQVIPIAKDEDLFKLMSRVPDMTHLVVSAFWIKMDIWRKLLQDHPFVEFANVCHSNVGFLQADPNGIAYLRQELELEAGMQNFHVAGNSLRFVNFVEQSYGFPCTWLPNLYYTHHLHHVHRPIWSHAGGGHLRIGIFGATRSLKNFMSGVAAALQVARHVRAPTEIWVNSERDDGPESKTIRRAIHGMTDRVPGVTLKMLPWTSWPQFQKQIGHMNLLIQPSYTESFNMVTADGIVEGVPSVVSEAVHWAPDHWKAEPDDVQDIARKAIHLLHDPLAQADGIKALKRYITVGIHAWEKYLLHNEFGTPHGG